MLRNLAVAHTSAGDLEAATQAWSHYLETLYLHDLLAGDPHRGAGHRAEVHRILAGSFGTAVLVVRTTRDADSGEAARDMPPVLASRAKVSIAIAHLRLEELNHVLSYRSPTLLLGVGRSSTEAELAMARDRRLALAEASTAALSPRVRVPFTDLCRQAIESAHQAATATGGRIRRPTDETEEEAHSAWAKERILWKQRIDQAVVSTDADWPLTEYSGDVIGNLQLIDELALDPLDEFIRRGVKRLGVQGDPTEFLERYNQLSDRACKFALGQIFDTAEQSSSTFPDQFGRICESWARNSIPDSYLALLDDPQDLYHPSAKSALDIVKKARGDLDEQDRRVIQAAATALERWVARLPGATGPARALAGLLYALDRKEEADRILSTAEAGAFFARGRREIAVTSIWLAIDRAKYREARERIRELLQAGTAETRLRELLIEAYRRWIETGINIPRAGQIKDDLSPWNDDPQAVKEGRVLVFNATIRRHKLHPSGLRPEALGADLREICADDNGNTDARFQLVLILHWQAGQVREQVRRGAGPDRRDLQGQLDSIRAECAGHADLLLADGALSSKDRKQLTDILREVRPDRR